MFWQFILWNFDDIIGYFSSSFTQTCTMTTSGLQDIYGGTCQELILLLAFHETIRVCKYLPSIHTVNFITLCVFISTCSTSCCLIHTHVFMSHTKCMDVLLTPCVMICSSLYQNQMLVGTNQKGAAVLWNQYW